MRSYSYRVRRVRYGGTVERQNGGTADSSTKNSGKQLELDLPGPEPLTGKAKHGRQAS